MLGKIFVRRVVTREAGEVGLGCGNWPIVGSPCFLHTQRGIDDDHPMMHQRANQEAMKQTSIRVVWP